MYVCFWLLVGVQNMNKQYVGKDFSTKSGMGGADKLTPDKVDEAAEVHMPLCMKVIP
jgi:hypothetical protein